MRAVVHDWMRPSRLQVPLCNIEDRRRHARWTVGEVAARRRHWHLPFPRHPATSPSPQAASQSLCHETTCGWSSRRLGRPRTWRTQARISARSVRTDAATSDWRPNSHAPKPDEEDAPLRRDAPRHHRHHDVSAADGRRPRHAHVARQLSNALQAAGGSNCQCRLALPVRGPGCSLSPPTPHRD